MPRASWTSLRKLQLQGCRGDWKIEVDFREDQTQSWCKNTILDGKTESLDTRRRRREKLIPKNMLRRPTVKNAKMKAERHGLDFVNASRSRMENPETSEDAGGPNSSCLKSFTNCHLASERNTCVLWLAWTLSQSALQCEFLHPCVVLVSWGIPSKWPYFRFWNYCNLVRIFTNQHFCLSTSF